MTEIDCMLREVEALVAMSIESDPLRSRFVQVLTFDFVKILGKDYKVIVIIARNPKVVANKKSHYFYVFDQKNSPVKINQKELENCVTWANQLIGQNRRNNSQYHREIQILKTYEKAGLITLAFDGAGNLEELKLNHCVLLIRLADHELSTFAGDDAGSRYEARKAIVDSLHYYNVDDHPGPVKLDPDNPNSMETYKKGREKVEFEFRKKLIKAGIESDLIEKIIDKVNKIF